MIQASTFSGQSADVQIPIFPDSCPLCHTGIVPKQLWAVTNHGTGAPQVVCQVVFRCTSLKCNRLFIGLYEMDPGSQAFNLSSCEPMRAKESTFSEEIDQVSPQFVTTYNQAMAAEAHHLDQIHGIGLGKALEILVKDFAVSQYPDKKDDILKMYLGPCIRSYIDDPKVKVCAERATWLRNDETHYIRKWEDKDVTDLKVLIRLTVNWIENILLTKQYEYEMPPRS
jgi:hypothetical protein